tara:strand:+ start:4 stop:537 length:534 start_codon:yes stop_codon:yes gene_type:complete
MITVIPVKDHLKHKKNLLKLIDSFEKSNDVRGDDHSSDYVVLQEAFREIKRPYLEYFYKHMIDDVLKNVGDDLGLYPYTGQVHNAWFQRYNKTDTHTWHNHRSCHFTNCYFLELPNIKYKTEIVDRFNKVIEYEAQEGDVITFPAWLKHRSPPNMDKKKTVISFNSSYGYPSSGAIT